MTREQKAFLERYLSDMDYWSTVDIDSVNGFTSGTPEFKTKKDLENYKQNLKKALA